MYGIEQSPTSANVNDTTITLALYGECLCQSHHCQFRRSFNSLVQCSLARGAASYNNNIVINILSFGVLYYNIRVYKEGHSE